MALRFKLLGSLKIEKENGDASEVMKWNKGCALLAYLILVGQAQRRELLADLLWDAPSTSRSLQNLRKLLSRMRKWVPELEVTRTQVAYPQETAVAIDYLTLSNILNAGGIAEMDSALSFYEGDLLTDFYLDDAPRFNEWLLIEREKLRQRVMATYRQICFAYSEQGTWDKGIAAAQRWLALDEFDEDALRQLLQLLAASGQIEVALQQYEASRQRLWAELAVEPAPETVQLVQHLQTLKEEQGGGLSWSAIVGVQLERPLPGRLSEPGELPSSAFVPYQRNNDFTGRRESLLHLANLLLPDGESVKQRAVVVTGMGGLGKTQLAVEFCYRYGRYFPGGVFWLSFANGGNVADEVAVVGGERSMGLYRDSNKLNQLDKVGRVRRAWQEAIPRLLIFDNCEEERLLAEWLPVTGGCRVLITSKRAVWTPELGVTTYTLKQLDRIESVRLLQHLVPTAGATAADEIAQEVGDLPLALYLAGSFLRRYPQFEAAQYLNQLRHQGLLQHPSLQGRGATHSPTGHELHVARTFALNFAQLDANDETDAMAQQMLACAIAFAHGEAIPQQLLLACVQSEPDDLLAELLAMDGLTRLLTLGILRAESRDSVQIHHLVAEYATAELGELVDVGRTAVEHHLLHLLDEQFTATRFLGQLPFATTHLQTITKNGLARADDSGTHFALWLGRHLRDVGALVESRAILETAVPLRRTLLPDGDLVLADLLSILGTLIWEMGATQEAWPAYEEALAIRQHILGEVHTLTAQSMQNLALLHSRTGSLAKAKTYYEQAVAIYEQLDPPDEQHIALTRNNMSIHYRRMNLFAAAEEQARLALQIREKILPPTSPWIAASLNSLGFAALKRGDYGKALGYYERALQIRQGSLGARHNATAQSLINIGVVKSKMGRYDEAEHHIQEGLSIRQAQLPERHPDVGQSLRFLGQHYYEAGDLEQAQSCLERAVAILAEKRPNSVDTADIYIYLANCHVQKGALDLARSCLEKARTIQENSLAPDHFYTAYRLLGSGDLALAEGDPQAARELYEQAVKIFGETAVPDHPDWQIFLVKLATLT